MRSRGCVLLVVCCLLLVRARCLCLCKYVRIRPHVHLAPTDVTHPRSFRRDQWIPMPLPTCLPHTLRRFSRRYSVAYLAARNTHNTAAAQRFLGCSTSAR